MTKKVNSKRELIVREDASSKAMKRVAKAWERSKEERECLISDFQKNRGIEINSNEVMVISIIWERAKKVFPDFGVLPIEEQLEVLEEAYGRTEITSNSFSTLQKYAKSVFEEIYMIGVCERMNVRKRTYQKIHEWRIDRDVNGECVEKNALKMVQYEYYTKNKLARIKSSFLPSDLWNFIAGNY